MLLDKAKGESAYIFRLEQAKSAEEILAIAHEISKQLNKPKYDFLRRSIYSWISRLLRKRANKLPEQQIDTVEDTVMLEQRIAQWEEELMQKGKAEGLLLGKKEGLEQQKTTMLEMLSDRFDVIPSSWTYIIEGINDPDAINRLIRAIYKVKSSQEFGEILTQCQ